MEDGQFQPMIQMTRGIEREILVDAEVTWPVDAASSGCSGYDIVYQA